MEGQWESLQGLKQGREYNVACYKSVPLAAISRLYWRNWSGSEGTIWRMSKRLIVMVAQMRVMAVERKCVNLGSTVEVQIQ